MAAGRPGLAQRRRSAGFSQEQLAERLGVERSTVARWERAQTQPQPWLRPRLAAALGISLVDLDALLGPDSLLVDSGADGRARFLRDHPASVDLIAVATLHEQLRVLDDAYDHAPSTTLLGPAGHLHAQVGYLRQAASNGRVSRALIEVEAESAVFLSRLVWDASQRRDHLTPMRYLARAADAAGQAHEPFTEAYAMLRMSYIVLYGEKNPVKGTALAAHAADLAGACSPALMGLAKVHVAEGHAMTGDRRECERNLGQAEEALPASGHDDIGAPYFTLSEYRRVAGSCYLALGAADRAELILSASAAALAGKKKSQAIALGNLALALIRQRKPEQAAAVLHQTIDAVELIRGGGGLNLAFAAGRELRPWQQESWAQEIRDRLMALMEAA
jgi:transcriptional regulator with XRE-family HTH domain